MGLIDRISAARGPGEQRFGVDQWINEYLLASQFGLAEFGLNQTYTKQHIRDISATLPSYLAALKTCPPAFAAQMVRALVLSQVRFTMRNKAWTSTPGRKFGTTALGLLERPWPNATTSELVSRMEWHAGLAGNAYVTRRPDRLRVLRPDWVGVIYGSDLEPDNWDLMGHALDGELLGYAYCNGGFGPMRSPIQTILPHDMAHWSPIPDPESPGVGMSWITSAVRDMQADRAATEHKLQFFANGATPNLVVKGLTAPDQVSFNKMVDSLEERHSGVRNAYRTLYLTAGADATVVGANLAQMDFKATQGGGETRLSYLSRVPAALLGISEGLAGSALNAGNFGMARRMFSDTWIHPTLQDLAATLAVLVNTPGDADLWFDTSDMPILREDAKDAAEIVDIKASSIVKLANGGYTRASAAAAVESQDLNLLVEDPNWVSVQVQPGSGQPANQGGQQ